jgi:acyl-CoA synthetase (AMP-forming)/AMP-acid ligase II
MGSSTVADRDVTSLCDLFEASVRANADRTAVVAPDGSTLTYAELNDRAERVAGFLRARGVAPGDRVGFCLPKGTASLAVMLGAMKARAAYVPVDWQGPAARNRTILSDCGVAALFLGEERSDVLR